MSIRHWQLSRTLTVRLVLAAIAALAAFVAAVAPGDAATPHVAIVGYDGDDDMRAPQGTIVQGDTVVFRWDDDDHDMVLSGPEGTRVGEQSEGFSLTRKIERPGQYTFLCTLHDNMDAQFTVLDDPNMPEPTVPPAVDVVVKSSSYDPRNVTIVEGQTVNWQWSSSSRDVTFDDGQTSGPGTRGGAPWSRTFTTAGTYAYRDSSRGFTGTVTVLEPGSGPLGIRPAPAGATPNATVTVGPGNSFAPNAVTIDEGGVVTWNWAGGVHNVRFEDGTDSGFRPTGSVAMKFYTPSDQPLQYVCTAHSGMAGTVTVRDTGAPGPNEQPPAVVKQPPSDSPSNTNPTTSTNPTQTSTRPGSGGGGATATASDAGAAASTADRLRPTVGAVRALLRRGRRSHRLRLTVSEDVMLQVTLQRMRAGGDLVGRRAFRLYARKGTRTLRLPVMNLAAGRYRLRFVAIDRAGNKAAARTLTARVR
jgi:plastocyanin